MKKYRIKVNGEVYDVEVEELGGEKETPVNPVEPASPPSAPSVSQKEKPSSSKQKVSAKGEIKAPMSGKVLRTSVQEGEEVKQGQVLLLLEAMKMENEINAPGDGKIKEIRVKQGDSVNPGDTLLILE